MARKKISAASTVGGDSVGINLSVVVLTALRAEGDENGGGWRPFGAWCRQRPAATALLAPATIALDTVVRHVSVKAAMGDDGGERWLRMTVRKGGGG
jgi:hypothetical protein